MNEIDSLYSKIDEESAIVYKIAEYPFHHETWLKWFGYYQRDGNRTALKALRFSSSACPASLLHVLHPLTPLFACPTPFLSLRIISSQTCTFSNKGKYKFDGNLVNICTKEKVISQAESTICYDLEDTYKFELPPSPNTFITKVTVLNGDCLETAIQMKLTLNLNPVVLNMASPKRPGGGYRSGSGAQEENLFRRSNYFQSLEDSERLDKKRKWSYPLGEFTGIYSPSVYVFRSSEKTGYQYLPEPIEISFLAVPAYRRPRVIQNKLAEKFSENTKKKIRIIFYISLVHGHDSVVLSAFGCGAFKNPPGHIALLFKEVMEEECFRGRFKYIMFAIFDDSNAGQKHNPEGNLLPFLKVFEEVPPFFEKVDFLLESEQKKEKKSQEKEKDPKQQQQQNRKGKKKKTEQGEIVKKTQKNQSKIINTPESTDEVIYFNSPLAPYGCFSPLFKSFFQLDGKEWLSVENYFYAKKYSETHWAESIGKMKQPHLIKEHTLQIPHEDETKCWDEQKDAVMYQATLAKFQQNPDLQNILLENSNRNIVFYDSDPYWGCLAGNEGNNKMGKILSEVRELFVKSK